MATIANVYDPNDPNAQSNNGGSGTITSSTGGSGGGAPASIGAQQTPSGAPNVQAYLNANQGAGQQLSQGITNTAQKAANQVDQSANTAQNQLNKQYQPLAGNLDANKAQGLAQTAFKDPQALLDSYNQAKTQSSNTPLTSQQQQQANQYTQFQQLNNGGYNSAIGNYGQAAQNQTGQLQNQLQDFNKSYGSAANELAQGQLLQKAVGNPNYNQGQQTLDSLFLQAQPGNIQNLQKNLSGISQNVGQNVNQVGSDAQSRLQALQGLSAQDQSYIKNLFTNGQPGSQNQGLSGIASNVGNEYSSAQTNSAKSQADAIAALTSGQISSEQAKSLGVDPTTHTWGLSNLQNYYSPNALNAANQGGNAQVATPEEFARYNALNQLAGGPAGVAQPSIFGSATTAGGYTPGTFDTSRLNTDIAARQGAVNTDYQNNLNQAIAQLGNVGHVGPGRIAPWQLASELQAQQKAGTLTPEQAEQLMNHYTYNGFTAAQAGGGQGTNTFNNFFNNEYAPASEATFGIAPNVNSNIGPYKGP